MKRKAATTDEVHRRMIDERAAALKAQVEEVARTQVAASSQEAVGFAQSRFEGRKAEVVAL